MSNFGRMNRIHPTHRDETAMNGALNICGGLVLA
jgi:hypothetical protein